MKLKFPQRLYAVTAGFLICSALTSETYALDLADCVYPGNVPTYSAPDIQFLPDGETYAMLSADGKRISTYDCKTASETGVIMDVDNTRENKIGRIESYTISPDGSKILVKTESSPIYRRRNITFTKSEAVCLKSSLTTIPVSSHPCFRLTDAWWPLSTPTTYTSRNSITAQR